MSKCETRDQGRGDSSAGGRNGIMTIEEAIVAHLGSFAGLVDLQSTRVYPVELPQGAVLPSTVYQQVSGIPEHSHNGRTGLERARFQISHWANRACDAVAVAVQTNVALDAFRGVMGGSGGVRVGRCARVNRIMDRHPEMRLYRVIQDFMFWYDDPI